MGYDFLVVWKGSNLVLFKCGCVEKFNSDKVVVRFVVVFELLEVLLFIELILFLLIVGIRGLGVRVMS